MQVANPTVELFGHCILVEGYSLLTFSGFHALIALRDTPGKVIAVMSGLDRFQNLLETALATGNLVAILGAKMPKPIAPRGGTWTVDVYSIDGVILYNMK
jgi:hypothetical protein